MLFQCLGKNRALSQCLLADFYFEIERMVVLQRIIPSFERLIIDGAFIPFHFQKYVKWKWTSEEFNFKLTVTSASGSEWRRLFICSHVRTIRKSWDSKTPESSLQYTCNYRIRTELVWNITFAPKKRRTRKRQKQRIKSLMRCNIKSRIEKWILGYTWKGRNQGNAGAGLREQNNTTEDYGESKGKDIRYKRTLQRTCTNGK